MALTSMRPTTPFLFAAVLLAAPAPRAEQPMPDWRRAEIELAKKLAEDIAALGEEAKRRDPQGEPTTEGLDFRFDETYTRVIQPRLKVARTCRERISATNALVEFIRQQNVHQGEQETYIGSEELGNVTIGEYANVTHDRCMTEAYRRCVVEDDPNELFAMMRMIVQRERYRVIMGAAPEAGIDFINELDPRVVQCRGRWYKVRFTREDRTDGELHFRDVVEGWVGRGLHEGFQRRAESRGVGAKCPDGECGDICHVTEIGEGEAEVRASPWEREFFIRSRKGQYKVRRTNDTCPKDAAVDAMDTDVTYTVRVPDADLLTPLTGGAPEIAQVPADPKFIASIDPWTHMFEGKGAFDLSDEFDEKLGTVQVLDVCDGKEMYGRGTPACKEAWLQALKAHEKAAK